MVVLWVGQNQSCVVASRSRLLGQILITHRAELKAHLARSALRFGFIEGKFSKIMGMLIPKKVKYRKWHTMRRNPNRIGLDTRGTELSFGSFGLQATSAGRIKSNQLESARKAMSRSI